MPWRRPYRFLRHLATDHGSARRAFPAGALAQLREEGMLEVRALELPDLDERRSGALVAVYRYLGRHFKVGVGYNFTDFSEDLTDLSYDNHGVFFNVIGSF
mgnify:CR=1 FL=1